jgi:hypothetical protein
MSPLVRALVDIRTHEQNRLLLSQSFAELLTRVQPSDDELRRELVKVLGAGQDQLVVDLAKITWGWALGVAMCSTQSGGLFVHRLAHTLANDAARLRALAAALKDAADLLAGLSGTARHLLGRRLGADWRKQLGHWHEATLALSSMTLPKRVRGRQKERARLVAEDVARALAAHGIPPTGGSTGAFASVLDVVLVVVGIPAPGIQGLVKDVVESLPSPSRRARR